MRNVGRPGRQFRSFLWRASAEDEVDADLAFHLDMTTRELVANGMPESLARAEAERRFGDVRAVNAACRQYATERDRHARRTEFRVELLQDVRFALRQLMRARGFSAIAILTLALGFGATAAVFSALYAVVLHPLPFDHPERVVVLLNSRKGELVGASAPDFLALHEQARGAFEHVAATVLQSGFTIRSGETPELVGGGRVSSEYFAVFGVTPQLGRTFSAEEDTPGRDNVVVLSHRAWVKRFHEDVSIIGRAIQVDGAPRTVIGVMPARFDLTTDAEELWVPLALTPEQRTKYNEHFLQLFARLKPAISMRQGASVATAARRAMIAGAPERRDPVSDYGVVVHSYVDEFVGDYKSLLLILLGAVGFVLLIACTNVASLLIARGTARARELSIRAALGAGRGRLVRQLLTESLVLGTGGAFLGITIAHGLLRLIVGVSPSDVPRLEQARVDWHVLVFTLSVAIVSTLFFGLLPALRAAGANLERVLREGGRGVRGGRDRLRGMLVGAEVALAMTLLIGAGLLIRSALLVQRVSPGFDPRGVLTARLVLPAAQYADAPSIVGFYRHLYNEANGLPGVRSAALNTVVPLSGNSMNASVIGEGQSRDLARPLSANLRLATPRYFEAMRIPILAGRDLGEHDDESAPAVVVINQALSAKLFPNVAVRDVIGKRIDAMSTSRAVPHWMEVVGVVGNLKDAALSQPTAPEFYAPVSQAPPVLWPLIQRSLVLVLRGVSDVAPAESMERLLKQAVAAVDPSLPVSDVHSMRSFVQGSQRTARFNTLLLTTLGAIALALAMIGVYGVVSYFVTQRRQEIAVRMALGATRGNIWQYVVGRGLRPLLAGLAAGTLLAALTARVLQSQLYRVTPSDPLTFGATGGLLLVIALLATYAPARQAMRVAPVVALNEQ